MDGVQRFHPPYERGFARVFGGVDQIRAGLVEGDGVERGENAYVGHFGGGGVVVAVAVYRKVFHRAHVRQRALLEIHNRLARVRHGFEKLVLLAVPHVVRVAGPVDVGLAVRRGDPYGNVFERASETSHLVPFEVR